MSYRSIKRMLGETSLERKCRFLFGACLLLLILLSFWWYGYQTETLVDEQNRNTGRLLVDQEMVTRHWRGLASRDKAEVFPEFAKIIPQWTQSLRKQEYQAMLIQANPPAGKPGVTAPRDSFEAEVWDQFAKAKPAEPRKDLPEYRERLAAGGNQYQYYQAIRAKVSCLVGGCHDAPPGGAGIDLIGTGGALAGAGQGPRPPLNEGDLMAVLQVSFSNEPTQRSLAWNRGILLATAIITAFLAMVAAYVIVRYVIVKPLRHLRDVSDGISRGNMAMRAEIHTGDEFEELALAFNRMLRHLTSVQEELRQVNVNLDGKVDELAQMNMRLYEMNTIKSDFLATMSHELRTPLNSILGFSEVLGSIDALTDKQKRYVQNIQKSGRALLEMINDILDLAKIESGKMEIRLTDFAVEQIVAAQCDMARPLTEKKNIDLETQLPSGLPPLHQDQARVQQVLNNLLSNAVKFTPEGGRITVSAGRDAVGVGRDEQESLVLQVADTGVGIAEEDQQTIFEKFRQGRATAPSGDAITREYSGSGLGLSIVKEICRLLGGSVAVESALGKGSTFTVRLPWRLEEQPRLDSALAEGFEEFARARFDLAHDHAQPAAPA